MFRKTRKTVLMVFCAVAIVLIGIFGIRYYLDHVRLPEIAPRQVVAEYFEALKGKDYKKAYSFISLRHYNNSYNQFIDRVSMYSPEMQLEVAGETIKGDTAVVDARVVVPLQFGPYSSYSNMDLVRVKREWKIIHP
ncbi:MAG: DUF4829 domain-containing protein [Desulfovibrio sp.]|jgi:hypothetical protein|nr:DUF4829 domain-containing protein [Desulfovibrio sp.]